MKNTLSLLMMRIKTRNKTLFFLTGSLLVHSCQAQQNPNDPRLPENLEKFQQYWNSGEAEISKYSVSQNRNGELQNETAIFIYELKDFLIENHVETDSSNWENSISVLKMNAFMNYSVLEKDFNRLKTIYTPIDARKIPHSLKTTFNCQNWGGSVYSQTNIRNGKITIQTFSNKENQKDDEVEFIREYMEDDIWTRIRLNPQTLPLGKITIIPSLEFLNLYQKAIKPYDAIAGLNLQIEDNKSGNEFYIYTLTYPELKRKITIKCQAELPFQIVEWEETIDQDEAKSKIRSRGVLEQSKKVNNKNSGELGVEIRRELGMD